MRIDLNDKKTFGIILASSVIILLLLCTVVWDMAFKDDEPQSQVVDGEVLEDATEEVLTEEMSGAETEIETEERVPELKELPSENNTYVSGIDVSHYQGNIDWVAVAESDIEFAMIRVGSRNSTTGEIAEDECARYNLQEANANGIPVGAYFFSSATTEEEILEEVSFLCDIIDGYSITYPVAYNCETYESENSRQYELTVEERSNLANKFLEEIENRGYVGMFYASEHEMTGDLKWNASELELDYRVWVAQYKESTEATISENPTYSGEYAMWQFTNQASVSGIDGDVDMNIAYFSCSEMAIPIQEGLAIQVGENIEVGVDFKEVNQEIMPKEEVNVRSTMDQTVSDNILGSIVNGEVVTRTGIGNNGWSRIEYNGESAYVISQYVTEDLSYRVPVLEEDGFDTVFMDASENVTAKDVTNLRNRPSVEAPSEVITQLTNGQVAIRTGVSNEGWSRVEYNGQVLYCVSSYLVVVQ